MDANQPVSIPVAFLGRREIVTDADVIDESNLSDEISKAMKIHMQNRVEIQYLWDYYRGEQPILRKEKKVRPDINNKIVVNKAHEIVDFHSSYITGEPITYISRTEDESVMKNITKLNDAMYTLGKADQDASLIEWDMICGTAYRYISTEKVDDVPFNMYTLDPRNSFVVYSADITRKRKMGVTYYIVTNSEGSLPVVGDGLYKDVVFEVYTENMYYKVIGDNIVEQHAHYLGEVPIIEYPANKARQGAFEVVLPLLDALNAAYSDRLDSVDSFVQAFMKFVNCDIDKEGLDLLKEYGAIKIKSEPNLPADVELVTSEMNQQQTQTLVDSIENQIILICGLPNRNGGLSTSDTGRAVELRDGWVNASAKAKASENAYKKADKDSVRIIFKICSQTGYLSLKASDVESQFTRRNYDNLQSKSQVLIAMLQNPKIAPKLAFECSGMFTDPESAYKQSMEYYDEHLEELQKQQATTPSGDANTEQRSSKNAEKDGTTQSNPILKGASEESH